MVKGLAGLFYGAVLLSMIGCGGGGGGSSNASSQPAVKSKSDKPASGLGQEKSSKDKSAGSVGSFGGLEEDGVPSGSNGSGSQGEGSSSQSQGSGSLGGTTSGSGGNQSGSGSAENQGTKPHSKAFTVTFDVSDNSSVALNKDSFTITLDKGTKQDKLKDGVKLYKKLSYSEKDYLDVDVSYANKQITVKPKKNLEPNSKYVLMVEKGTLIDETDGSANQQERFVGFNTNVTVADCDGGFSLQDPKGTRCYKFLNEETKTYSNAKSHCEGLTAALVEKDTIEDWLKTNAIVNGSSNGLGLAKHMFEKLGGVYGTEYWIGDEQVVKKRQSNVNTDFRNETNTNAQFAFICYKDKITPEVDGSGKFDGEKTVTFKFNKDLKWFAANTNVVLTNGQNSSGVTSANFKKETKTLTVELANVESGKQYTLTLNPDGASEKITDHYKNALAKVEFKFSKASGDQCSTLGGSKVGNSCYFKGEGNKRWSEANSYCESKGASLVSVVDGDDFNSIADKLNLIKYKPGHGENNSDAQPYWLKDAYKDPYGGSLQYRFFWYQSGKKMWHASVNFIGNPGTFPDIDSNRFPFVCKLN